MRFITLLNDNISTVSYFEPGTCIKSCFERWAGFL